MARKRKSARILVTGASGFLGAHLCAQLSQSGAKLRSLGRRAHDHLEQYGVEQVVGSVISPEDCAKAMDGIDQVYHLAGMVSRDPSDSGLMYDVHVRGTRNVLAACQDAKIHKIVVVSTSGTVGVGTSADFMAQEDSPTPWSLIGRWPYYESKAFAEREIQRFVDGGLPVRIARPTLLLGPGDLKGSSTGDVVRFLSGQVTAALPGGLSFVDVRDVADCLPRLMEDGEPGVGYLMGAINLGVRDFLLGLEQVSGVNAPAFTIPHSVVSRAGGWLKKVSRLPMFGGLDEETFEMGCHYWYIATHRACDELGFDPRDWNETLRDTVDDIRSIGMRKR
jgi:dihydroflavonol-4-reductase